jgi:hypothetical protein
VKKAEAEYDRFMRARSLAEKGAGDLAREAEEAAREVERAIREASRG